MQGKQTAFLHTLIVENERETSKLKYGGMFFSELEGHMQKLSSFGQGKKFGLKSHLCGCSTQPFKCIEKRKKERVPNASSSPGFLGFQNDGTQKTPANSRSIVL